MTNGPEIVRISPAEAHAKMQHEGFVYVDVRTPAEFAEGHPEGAVSVPLDGSFVGSMEKQFAKDAPIILGCQTGLRSLRAAKALLAAGFTRILDQRAGFDGAKSPFGELIEPGWSRVGLPQSR